MAERGMETLPPEEEIMTAEEVGTAEEPTGTEQELAAGAAGMKHTVEDIPELAGLKVGDTINFAIREISDDGNTYTLVATGEAGGLPEAGATSPEEGRAAVEAELMGATGGGGA